MNLTKSVHVHAQITIAEYLVELSLSDNVVSHDQFHALSNDHSGIKLTRIPDFLRHRGEVSHWRIDAASSSPTNGLKSMQSPVSPAMVRWTDFNKYSFGCGRVP